MPVERWSLKGYEGDDNALHTTFSARTEKGLLVELVAGPSSIHLDVDGQRVDRVSESRNYNAARYNNAALKALYTAVTDWVYKRQPQIAKNALLDRM